MDAAVEFKTAGAAEHFVRSTCSRGLGGCGFWTGDQWIAKANAVARAILAEERKPWHTPAPQYIAAIMRSYRKGGVRFLGVRCDCCGTLLTAPESVLAGRGPKCMMERA